MNQTGFWWILIAGAVYGVIHSLTASLKFKQLAVQWFGEPGRRNYRLFYVVLSLVTTPAYLALVVLLPDGRIYTVPQPWVFITLFVQLAALIGAALSFRGTGMLSFLGLESLFGKSKALAKSPLMTGGLYAYTRHPIYFFSLIFLWFLPWMSWNSLALSIGITLYTLIGSRFEENRLIHEFGQDYIDYRKKTPWIIPIKLK